MKQQDIKKFDAGAFAAPSEIGHGEWKPFVISYPWLSKDHPDPNGVHLKKLAELFMTFYYIKAHVFIDYCCLSQKDRTKEEDEQFNAALRNMHVLYTHDWTQVVRLDGHLPNIVINQYQDRGWCYFEQLVSQMKFVSALSASHQHYLELLQNYEQYFKPRFLQLDTDRIITSAVDIYEQMEVSTGDKIKRIADDENLVEVIKYVFKMMKQPEARRRVMAPRLPEVFLNDLDGKHFTNEHSDKPSVARLYKKVYDARATSLEKCFPICYPAGEVSRQLVHILPSYTHVTNLIFVCCELNQHDIRTLANALESGLLPSLELFGFFECMGSPSGEKPHMLQDKYLNGLRASLQKRHMVFLPKNIQELAQFFPQTLGGSILQHARYRSLFEELNVHLWYNAGFIGGFVGQGVAQVVMPGHSEVFQNIGQVVGNVIAPLLHSSVPGKT